METASTRWHPTFGLEYTAELQTDFQECIFTNLLQLNATLPVVKGLNIELASQSTVRSREDRLIDDLQGFSNIDAENAAFYLSVAGLSWQIDDSHSLFAGVRRMDEDYFATDVMSLFTNSSCGVLPTLSANAPIPIFPVSSLGVHYGYTSEHWGCMASLYNGTGYQDFAGRCNVFRFCPKSDGAFALAQGEYRQGGSRYFLGGALHVGGTEFGEIVSENHDVRTVVWTYAEQKVTSGLTLLGIYSHAFGDNVYCPNFAAIGARYDFPHATLGLVTDYTRVFGVDEWATEFTCDLPLTGAVSLQPTLHVVRTGSDTSCVGLMRLTVTL